MRGIMAGGLALALVGVAGATQYKMVDLRELGRAPVSFAVPEGSGPVVWKGAPASTPKALTILYTDSAVNQYSYWFTEHFPVDVAEDGNVIYWAYRAVNPDDPGSGWVKATWSLDAGATFQSYAYVNEDFIQLGGRYPEVCYHPDYVIVSGSDFSGTSSLDRQWVAAINRDDGSMVNWWLGDPLGDPFAGRANTALTQDGKIIVATGTYSSSLIYAGVWDPATNTWAQDYDAILADFDIINLDYDRVTGEAYLFGTDLTGGNGFCYYKLVWDGTALNVDGPYNITDSIYVPMGPGGEDLDYLFFMQGRVLRNGDVVRPVILMDLFDTTDVLAVQNPSNGFYYSPGRYITIVDADTNYDVWMSSDWSQNTDAEFQPTLASNDWGGLVVAFQYLTEYDNTLGWGMWDIAAVYGTLNSDGSMSFDGTLYNLSETTDKSEALPHVARQLVRVDDSNSLLYVTYGYAGDNYDLIYNILIDDGVYATYWDLAVTQVPVGVAERSFASDGGWSVADGQLRVALNLPAAGDVHLRIYDPAGRVVLTADKHLSAGSHTLRVPVDGLGHGTYFFAVSGATSIKGKFIR